jgi:hypothetical protein
VDATKQKEEKIIIDTIINRYYFGGCSSLAWHGCR